MQSLGTYGETQTHALLKPTLTAVPSLLYPQTVLLRWRRAVGLRRTAAASRAERKRASRNRVLLRVQKRASLAFGLPPFGGRGERIRSGLRRTLGSPRGKRKARLSGSPGRKSFLPN